MNINNRTTERGSDTFNPLLVREIRQSLRSNIFLLVIGVTSLFCMTVVICGLLNSGSNMGNIDFSAISWSNLVPGVGLVVFMIVFILLCLLACLVIPITAAMRFRAERQSGEFELFMITGIPVWRVIMGKLQASLTQVFLIIAVAAPFMVTTYLLRGISIISIFGMIISMILLSLLFTQMAIFIGSIKIPKALFTLLLFMSVTGVFSISGILFPALFSPHSRGAIASIASATTLTILLAATVIIYLLFFYFASYATLELSNKNRPLPLKIVFAVFVVSGVGYYTWLGWNGHLSTDLFVLLNMLFTPCLLCATAYLPMKSHLAAQNVRRRWKFFRHVFFAPFYPGKGAYMMFLSIIALILFVVPSTTFAKNEMSYLPILLTILSFWPYVLGAPLRFFMRNLYTPLISLISWIIPSILGVFLLFSHSESVELLAKILFPPTAIYYFIWEVKWWVYAPYMLGFWGIVLIHGFLLYTSQLRCERNEDATSHNNTKK